MNYAIVAFAIVIIISVVQWIIDGNKNYKGPKLESGAILNDEVEGLAVMNTHNSGQILGNGFAGEEKKKEEVLES